MIKNFKLFESKQDCPFLKTKSAVEDDYHQAILDVAYDWWQKGVVRSYNEMFEKMEQEYGYEFALLILLGKYNYQVDNGGHIQYWQNGCASYYSNRQDCAVHEQMMEWLEESDLFETEKGKQAYNIMQKALNVFEKFAEGETECDECRGSGEEEVTCYDCDGTGEMYDTCSVCNGECEVDVECPECYGDGEIDDEDCPECGGEGNIKETCEECDGEGEVGITCQECDGDGYTYDTCQYCDGSGWFKPEEAYEYQLRDIDDKYWNFEWMKELNKFAEKLIKRECPKQQLKTFKKDYEIAQTSNKYNL